MTNSFKEDNRPSQQWYWDDWFSAFDVRLCSLAARGLWIDMLGIMFKAEIRGTLTINGRQINGKHLAKIIGATTEEITSLIKELDDQDVFSRLPDGTIICRRMFKESGKKDQISRIRSEAGKKGADKRWEGKESEKINGKTKAKMAASSSSPTPTPTPSSKKEKEKPKDKKRNVPNQIDIDLTQLLIDKILENDIRSSSCRKMTEENQRTWIDDCRKLREIDERTPAEIKAIIEWCQNDGFWKANILSMGTLRKKFDRLFLQAKRDAGRDDLSGIRAWLKEQGAIK